MKRLFGELINNLKFSFAAILLLPLLGCQKPHFAEFVRVVQVHREVSQETCDAIVKSIDDALAEPAMPQAKRDELLSLKERLNYISSSAKAMDDYLTQEFLDDKLLQEILRSLTAPR